MCDSNYNLFYIVCKCFILDHLLDPCTTFLFSVEPACVCFGLCVSGSPLPQDHVVFAEKKFRLALWLMVSPMLPNNKDCLNSTCFANL